MIFNQAAFIKHERRENNFRQTFSSDVGLMRVEGDESLNGSETESL